MSRARVEYMVTWKRVGLRPKRKRYVSRHAADRFIALLGPEPWAALGLDPDMPYCCHASCVECDCNGRTVREESDRRRAEMPALEWVRLSTREVGEWVSAPAEEEGRATAAESRAARLAKAGAEFASQYGASAFDCRYDNSCDDSGREPRCEPCELRAAIAAEEGK